MTQALKPIEAQFVAAYVTGKGAKASALEAGCPPSTAQKRASAWLQKPAIIAAIEEHQRALRLSANYSAEKAMAELSEAMQFARSTRNANALAKCIELRSKLAGLLQEKPTAAAASFSINIVGLDEPDRAHLVVEPD
jgi:phage terminase small subunit